MATTNEIEFTLEDHLNKCRCCFRALMDQQKSVKITKSIEEKFFSLTQIQVLIKIFILPYLINLFPPPLQLVESNDFSKAICILCDNDLEVFSNFR